MWDEVQVIVGIPENGVSNNTVKYPLSPQSNSPVYVVVPFLLSNGLKLLNNTSIACSLCSWVATLPILPKSL